MSWLRYRIGKFNAARKDIAALAMPKGLIGKRYAFINSETQGREGAGVLEACF